MYSAMTTPWGIPPAPGTTAAYGTYQSTPFSISSKLTKLTQSSSASPAYHPVQVRQSFNQSQPLLPYMPTAHQPLAQHPAPVQEQPKKKMTWPEPVRDYVRRSFDNSTLLPDVTRAEMEAKLKQTISEATDNDALHTIDWVKLPLPQELIRAERQAAWQRGSVNFPQTGNGFNDHSVSKKRKSQDMGGGDDENSSSTSTPPWRNTNNRPGLEDRVSHQSPAKERLNKRQQLHQEDKGTSKSQKNLEKRQQRFNGGYKSTYKQSPEPEPSSGPVVGTCEVLEKKYFRLTSAPIPSHVRPERILRQTLEFLKKKWKKEQSYPYICDQFKSMRQDLTVQRIKNEFTVTVYEIHARIALEKGDLGEYNQCQTQLRALYAQQLGGNPVEFKAYRILYFIHTSNRTSLNDVLADLTTAEKEAKAIKHALDVRSALALGNYHKFFRLYLDVPNMGAYLMDMFVVRERLAAMSNICRAYKPDVSMRFITEELGFESDVDAAQFIVDNNGQHLLEQRDAEIRVLTGKAGSTFEAAKVAAFRKVDIKGQI
ncbi:ganp nin1 mts3 eif-3 p25 family protein [Phlyctema vagabunda]|uniref:Ganp nin1 mts3 eif-3 p25 family protein n=1 Tax=Phlyctema vagabunda TaxID=108571 RepID=A0ABR4PVN7_9HELO